MGVSKADGRQNKVPRHARFEAQADNSLQARDGHEAGRPFALEEADLAVVGAGSRGGCSEAFSIGIALVAGLIHAVILDVSWSREAGLSVDGLRVKRLRLEVAGAEVEALVVLREARLSAEQRLAGLESSSHDGWFVDSSRESRGG